MNEMTTSVEVIGNNADEFLQYINDNYDMLVDSLKKNKSFSEDSFQETILKCHSNIIKYNKIIQSHKNYFFWCVRNNFWCAQNKERKIENNLLIRNLFENDEEKNYTEDVDVKDYLTFLIDSDKDMEVHRQGIDDLFVFISNKVEAEFNTKEAMIWILYMKLKSNGKITYQQLSNITGLSLSTISNTVNKINKFVQANQEIIREKNKLNEL